MVTASPISASLATTPQIAGSPQLGSKTRDALADQVRSTISTARAAMAECDSTISELFAARYQSASTPTQRWLSNHRGFFNGVAVVGVLAGFAAFAGGIAAFNCIAHFNGWLATGISLGGGALGVIGVPSVATVIDNLPTTIENNSKPLSQADLMPVFNQMTSTAPATQVATRAYMAAWLKTMRDRQVSEDARDVFVSLTSNTPKCTPFENAVGVATALIRGAEKSTMNCADFIAQIDKGLALCTADERAAIAAVVKAQLFAGDKSPFGYTGYDRQVRDHLTAITTTPINGGN
jgi:hypothetical protein